MTPKSAPSPSPAASAWEGIDPATAWSPFDPRSDGPWDFSAVAHLHRRAGFLAPWSVLQRDLKDGPGEAVERLMEGEETSLDGQTASEFASTCDAMARGVGSSGLAPAQAAWLYRMIHTPQPLRERMTLFLHDHFAASEAKVRDMPLMVRQVALIRHHALGDFGALLKAMGKDPAMLIWLDATVNRRKKPNENYAREVMELFSLGRGKYTEKDIQEAARAFAGTSVVNGRYRDDPNEHDTNPKTILGRTGNYRGDDVADLLLDQPACAEFLCGKLVRHFLTDLDEPPTDLIAPLADGLRRARYDLSAAVRTILRSRLFFDRRFRRKKVKGPAEFVVGLIRALEAVRPTVKLDELAQACGRMGQSLFAPPSVAGWDGGPAWINTSTTLERSNFALGLISANQAPFGGRVKVDALPKSAKASSAASFYLDLLIQDGMAAGPRRRVEEARDARGALALIVTSPEFQLA